MNMINPENIVLGSFIGDALSLGSHWVYDHTVIREKLRHLTGYHPPITTFHAGKCAGDLTHYGDQTLVLLRSITDKNCFDLSHFANMWQEFWENPFNHSYRDGATKATLANLKAGVTPTAAFSMSQDIAGAARISPLFLLDWENDEALVAATRAQTAFTHGDPVVIEAAEFFTRTALALQRGKKMSIALEQTMRLHEWDQLLDEWLDNAIESAASSESDAVEINRHGLTCHTADAFPCICHLLLRHAQDPTTALIENAMAGGDCAARGMILGLVYGAYTPITHWPNNLLEELNARTEILDLSGRISRGHSLRS
ncbi:MAG: ADP-ribosylglycohydrolase family protein [Akkermansiaceae bacterium]|nr:ADP-ribosylglycohydrolase family protein [Akkermansiaceae bacterium]